jgi:hypothetical protein
VARKTKARVAKPALHLEPAYRSTLEKKIGAQLTAAGAVFEFENEKLEYEVPARTAKYLPDFKLANGIYIEAKGWLQAKDRQKMILVKEAHPDKDIRMVFQRAQNPIYTGSKTTYAKWADDHGFPWADKGVVPASWLKEKPKKRS